MAEKNGNVKWWQLIPLLLLVSGYAYAESKNSVSKDVFSQFEKRFDISMNRLFDEIKTLRKD